MAPHLGPRVEGGQLVFASRPTPTAQPVVAARQDDVAPGIARGGASPEAGSSARQLVDVDASSMRRQPKSAGPDLGIVERPQPAGESSDSAREFEAAQRQPVEAVDAGSSLDDTPEADATPSLRPTRVRDAADAADAAEAAETGGKR